MIEKSSRESPIFEDEVETILNAILDGVIIQNESRQVEFVNRAAADMLGDETERICREFFENTDRMDEAERTNQFCFERDGKHFRASVARLGDQDGITRTVRIIRDITSIRRLQQELEQSREVKALGQMILGIAHDLNNSLSAILGRAQLLQQSLHNQQKLRSGLKIIEKAASDATETIKKIQQCTRSTKEAEVTSNLSTAERTEKTEQLAQQVPARAVSANILVIDDETVIRELFYEILARDGHAITLSASSSEGLRAFDEGSYDIVYTDLGMPDVSGWDVASAIKRKAPSTAVVMITGREVQMDDEKIKESGIDLVIPKPFQIRQIRDSVSQAMKIRAK
jgi:CheY-like chemotaxis protein